MKNGAKPFFFFARYKLFLFERKRGKKKQKASPALPALSVRI
jgi:hypothetical protein